MIHVGRGRFFLFTTHVGRVGSGRAADDLAIAVRALADLRFHLEELAS